MLVDPLLPTAGNFLILRCLECVTSDMEPDMNLSRFHIIHLVVLEETISVKSTTSHDLRELENWGN